MGQRDKVTSTTVVLGLAHRNVGPVARTNAFEVTFQVRYSAAYVRSSKKSYNLLHANLAWDDSVDCGVVRYGGGGRGIGADWRRRKKYAKHLAVRRPRLVRKQQGEE